MAKPSSFPPPAEPKVLSAGKNGSPKKTSVDPASSVKEGKFSTSGAKQSTSKVRPQRG